jgi:hypothetical protein
MTILVWRSQSHYTIWLQPLQAALLKHSKHIELVNALVILAIVINNNWCVLIKQTHLVFKYSSINNSHSILGCMYLVWEELVCFRYGGVISFRVMAISAVHSGSPKPLQRVNEDRIVTLEPVSNMKVISSIWDPRYSVP